MLFKIAWDRPTRRCLEAGFLQGLLLLGMHKAIEHSIWPLNRPTVLVPLYLLILVIPPVAALLSEQFNRALTWKYLAGLSAVLAAMALYTVRTEVSVLDFMDGSRGEPILLGCLAISAALLTYISLVFAQARLSAGGPGFSYRHLFEYSWNNIVSWQISGLFCHIFWMLLGLLGGMFAMLGIQFFLKLYVKPFFFYPVTTGALAYGLSFSRMHGTLVLGQRNTILLIFKNLLPVAASIALLFLAALPFTGLQPIWDTKHATVLLVNLQVCLIFFFNAVYQDGSAAQRPYPRFIRRLVLLGILTLPVYSALDIYSLGLRVMQHGWTVSRVLAALIVTTVALYSIGYGWTVARRQPAWMQGVEGVNIRVAVFIMAVAVLLHTPLLDPRLVAARSQVSRLTSGKVAPEKFDFDYLRFHLGVPGYRAVERLAKLQKHPAADKIRELAKASLEKKDYVRYRVKSDKAVTEEQFAKQVLWFPAGRAPDAALVHFLVERINRNPTWTNFKLPYYSDKKWLVWKIDLNGDDSEEAVVVNPNYQGVVFSLTPEGWKQKGLLRGEYVDPSEIQKKLEQGDFSIESPRWKEIQIGKNHYAVEVREE
jgi:hypothetical protein